MSARPTILFDLDGTLADTAADLCETLNVILERHGRDRVPEGDVRGLVGGGARVLLERGFERTGAPASNEKLDRLFAEFIEHYSAHSSDRTQLFPGVRDELERLQAAGWLMAVCTNKIEELTHPLLKALQIDHYFPVVIGGDTLPVKKPDPEHLWEAVRRLGGETDHAVMIGDSETDTAAAENAGLPCICVTFGYRRVALEDLKVEALIESYAELPAALTRLPRFAALA